MTRGDRVVVISPNGLQGEPGIVLASALNFGREEITVDLDCGKVRRFWLHELRPESEARS